MSAIFGLMHLDGQPIDPDSLRAMQTAMHYWGPDGSGLWHHGSVGLGHLMLYNTPESLYETMPLVSTAGDLVLSARARLDNRDELCDALGVPHPERATTPDGALLLRAYQKWGEACPDHVLGDWVCAIWDARQRRLFIARDHYGSTGLYYYHSPTLFAFASCLKGLFALSQVPRRLNGLRVVQVIVSWPEHGAPTAYEEICRLPPAHTLAVTADRLEVRQYWHLEDAPAVRLKSDDAYVEAFLERYTAAVRCRLRSYRPVGATLSGGLDSGSVCALAACELAETGRRLPAFSSVPIYDTHGVLGAHGVGDERPFIEATSAFVGHIDVHYIHAEAVTPLQGIAHSLWLHDEPGHAAANAYWITALLATAQQQHIGTLLTGQSGNGTVSWVGGPSALGALTCVKQGRYRHAWRSLVRGLLPTGVMRWYRRPYKGKDPWRQYSAINRARARQLALTRLMRSRGHDPAFSPPADAREARALLLKPGNSIVGAIWQECGAGHGLEIRDPTADKRLMEFCLGIPDAQYSSNGRNRWLIRRAMAGKLPPQVQWNTLRGIQAADIGWRLLDSQAEIADALAQLERSPLARHYLELPLMWRVLRSLQTGVTPQKTAACGTMLLRGLMAGLFLRRFETSEPVGIAA